MTIDKMFNDLKTKGFVEKETQDAGKPDGYVSHRKDGDYRKQGGEWVKVETGKGGASKSKSNNSENSKVKKSLNEIDLKKLQETPYYKLEGEAKKAKNMPTPKGYRKTNSGQGFVEFKREDGDESFKYDEEDGFSVFNDSTGERDYRDSMNQAIAYNTQQHKRFE